MNTIKKYDAYLSIGEMPTAKQEGVRGVFAAEGLEVDVGSGWLEFAFVGRDVEDRVVRCFQEASRILGTVDGEVRCEIDDDEHQDPYFEFYTIRGYRLWRQTGRIVRAQLLEEVKQAPSP